MPSPTASNATRHHSVAVGAGWLFGGHMCKRHSARTRISTRLRLAMVLSFKPNNSSLPCSIPSIRSSLHTHQTSSSLSLASCFLPLAAVRCGTRSAARAYIPSRLILSSLCHGIEGIRWPPSRVQRGAISAHTLAAQQSLRRQETGRRDEADAATGISRLRLTILFESRRPGSLFSSSD